MPHHPPTGHGMFAEHSFERGDILGVARDNKTGYLAGDLKTSPWNSAHNGSDQLLHYPKYKVEEKVIAVPFRAFG